MNKTLVLGPHADEPIANDEWLAKYRERKRSYDERLGILQRRLDGGEEVRIRDYLLCNRDKT